MTLGSVDRSAAAWCAEGAAHTDRGDNAAAALCFAAAVALDPTSLDLHLLLANAQRLIGDELSARDTLRAAVTRAKRPDVHAEFALGSALVAAGAGADAVPCFRRVRSLRQRDPAAAAALAAALRESGDLAAAQREIDVALKLDARAPAALLTAARIQHDRGDMDRALQLCERSLRLHPNARSAQLTRSYLHHLRGQRADGFRDFEARAMPTPPSDIRRWNGESLAGRSLLVIGEQGVGDQFQFVRFVQHPRVQAAHEVVVSCQRDAVALLRASGINAVARGEEPACDTWVPLLSLPLQLEAFDDAALMPEPYLRATNSDDASATSATGRIGLVWAGNPMHHNDAVRSMPSALVQKFVDAHPEISCVSLQHGAQASQVSAAHVVSLAARTWLETAAILRELQLLITVDTGIAHLAGAMGVPVWLLVPHVPDWRWGMHGTTTPWYPSIRLFRQSTRGDWSGVMRDVAHSLTALRAP
jgi:tetratricopeptide (TPR) repeat protein